MKDAFIIVLTLKTEQKSFDDCKQFKWWLEKHTERSLRPSLNKLTACDEN